MKVVRIVLLCLAALFFVGAGLLSDIPPAGSFGQLHPFTPRMDSLLARRAPRDEAETLMRSYDGKPVRITSGATLLGIPPSMPPSKRALALLRRWPSGTYAQLIDDVRVLACFDSRGRLVAYDLF